LKKVAAKGESIFLRVLTVANDRKGEFGTRTVPVFKCRKWGERSIQYRADWGKKTRAGRI